MDANYASLCMALAVARCLVESRVTLALVVEIEDACPGLPLRHVRPPRSERTSGRRTRPFRDQGRFRNHRRHVPSRRAHIRCNRSACDTPQPRSVLQDSVGLINDVIRLLPKRSRSREKVVPAHVNRSRLLLLTKLRKQATRKRTSTTTTNITPIGVRQNSRRRLTGYHDHAKHTSATPNRRGTAETG